MAKGLELKNTRVEELITMIHLENPLLKAPAVHREVLRRIHDKKDPYYEPYIEHPEWPRENTVYQHLKKIIEKDKARLPKSKELDEPWSIAASVRLDIPPEASKDLFDIWRFSLAMDRPISIRQAKWIVHIRKLFYQPISTGNEYSNKVYRNLSLIRQSWLYSVLERASEIEEKHFDTTDLDAASFMSPLELATASKLGKVSPVKYPQEPLKKIEESGISLESPSFSIHSVEQAVWQHVRTEPPPDRELTDNFPLAMGLGKEPLAEEYDLVLAYWLNYLSKGPKWKTLDYAEQMQVRFQLFEWVTEQSERPNKNYYSILTKVGYQTTTEYHNDFLFKVHEKGLKIKHKGWNSLPAEVQQRIIHDEQTDDDLTLLENADYQSKVKQEQREQEIIELVQHKGGVPKSIKEKPAFWKAIRDEWVKRYPACANSRRYLQPEEVKAEYERLIRKQNNESPDSTEGGTK